MQKLKRGAALLPTSSELSASELLMVSGGETDGGVPQPPCSCVPQRDGTCKIVCKDQ